MKDAAVGIFGIPVLFVRSGTRVCLAFENLRLPEAAVSLLAEHRRALCRVGQADVGHRVPPPAFSGLTTGTAPSQGNELLLRFLRKRCSLIQQSSPFCERGAPNALRR